MGRWQRRRGHGAAARMAPVGRVVAVVLAAASIAGCRQQTSPLAPTRWHPRPVLLGALVTALALTLSACIGLELPPAGHTPTPVPTPELPRGCSYGGGRGIQPTSVELATSPPVAADGVVYVGYVTPDVRGDPARSQYALAALRARDGTTLWRVPAVSETWPVAVADGVLIAKDLIAGVLVGLRASDGATIWRGSLPWGPATASGGVLYVAAGGVYALRLADGRLLWQTIVRGGTGGAVPVVEGSSLYVGAGDGAVVALQAETGVIRWITLPSGAPFQDVDPSRVASYGPLAAAAGQVYVSIIGAHGMYLAVVDLHAVDGASAGYVLRLPVFDLPVHQVLMAGVYTAVFPPEPPPGRDVPAPPATITAYRLSASGGELLWRVPVQATSFGATGIAYDAQTVYLPDDPQGIIAAYRLADGAVRWHQQALASTDTGIVADAGYLFETASGMEDPCHTPAVHQAPQVRALATADGSIAWTQTLTAPLPALRRADATR